MIECENEKDWLHERSKLAVTASDAYTLLTKPLLHYARKKGLVDGPEQNERMLWGKRLQDTIARGFSEDTGRPVELADPFTIFVHPDYPMVGATPDALETFEAQEKGPLEIKSTDIEWQDEPPVWYQAQLQCQLAVLGSKRGTLAALYRGNKLVWADLMRHEDFIKRFLSKAEEMSWRLATNNPPEVDADGSEETSRAIAAMFPQDSGAAVALPAEAMQWTEELAALKNQKRALDEQITLRESWLKEQIKDATFGVLLDGSRWSWKKTTRVDPPRPEPRVTEYRTLRHLKGGK